MSNLLIAAAMISATTAPKAGVVPTLSDLKIAGYLEEEGQTPSTPILPPQPSGNYEVDESVITCKAHPLIVA